MPFVQMENISHFLRACQQPPLSLHSHDIFQTVDLYESKDPAQVLQCISAFSRRANAVQPSHFPNSIGGEKGRSLVSPQNTGAEVGAAIGRSRGMSGTSEASSNVSHAASQAVGGRESPLKGFGYGSSNPSNGGVASPSGGISSWSKKQDEGSTAPAWNIHQYGYMGGASQGNQGIAFGARRQITTQVPQVPSLAEKERKRKEQEMEMERRKDEAAEAERRRIIERKAEEDRERIAEEKRWEEETSKVKEVERQRVEEERRKWQEEETRWKEEEEKRNREEKESEANLKAGGQKTGRIAGLDFKLQGQLLSQYHTEQGRRPTEEDPQVVKEQERVKDLERQLHEAKEREARYEQERQERMSRDREEDRSITGRERISDSDRPRSKSRGRPVPYGSNMDYSNEDSESERNLLQQAWKATNSESDPPPQPPRPLPVPEPSGFPPPKPARPLPTPQASTINSIPKPRSTSQSPPAPTLPTRPLPNPATYVQSRSSPSPTRKSPFTRPTVTPSPPPPQQSSFHSSSTAKAPPQLPRPTSHNSSPAPASSPPSFKKPPSSLLAREMELDRLRQQEWTRAQEETAARTPDLTSSASPGGGAWDVHQYGYMGGDSQNRGNLGISGFGGARRQLVGGPREMPGSSAGGSGGKGDAREGI